jgi:rubrerythrin
MHIDSGSLIMFPKKSQNLEVVKTPEKFDDRELTRALRDAIIAEEGAIKQYEAAADATDNEKVKKTLQSIADEEKVHIGELQTLLNDLLPDEEKHMEKGKGEVNED